jgi:hypothetical protein
MKKISLTLIGLYLFFVHSFAQISKEYESIFKARPLKLEEVNFVTSYYNQDGNHSAVTGGIGTEKLTDFSNYLELKLVGISDWGIKHTINAGMGIDHHTAASQKYISATGASSPDGTRWYPSINWTAANEDKGYEYGLGSVISHEYNYNSVAFDGHVAFKNSFGGELNIKGSAYFDQVKMIYPSELAASVSSLGDVQPYDQNIIKTNASRGGIIYGSGGGTYIGEDNSTPSVHRNTFTGSMTYNQIIDKNSQLSFLVDVVKQDGYLALPFHRVYFTDGTAKIENLPTSRFKLPLGVRWNYFLGDKTIIRSYFRYYSDDWGMASQTYSLELPYKFTPFFSIAPMYRFYTQTASKYFAPYKQHALTDTYFTSNYAQSAFSSHFIGANVRMAPAGGFTNTYLSTLEIRFGHYTQTTDLNSNVISFHFTFK